MKKLKVIFKLLIPLLFVFAVILLVPLSMTFYFKESMWPFLVPALLSAFMGGILHLLLKNVKVQVNIVIAMMLTACAWMVISAIGGIPYMIGLSKGFIDAFFESVSAFTTTGITVFQGLDTMPKSILLWRSLSQWLGGLGILTFFLLIATNSEGELWQLFSAEGHKISSARPVPNVFTTIRIFWAIYGAFTAIETLLLWGLGLSFFDAINHALTSLSTGGFSTHDASIGYYQQMGYQHYKAIEYVIILFMALGGINFLVHYRVLRKERAAYFKDIETRGYLSIIGGFTVVSLIGIWMLRGLPLQLLEESFRKVLFQMVSLITTTGFGTEDIGSAFFPAVTKQLFIVLMIVGGSVGSTAGGIKVMRVLVLGETIKREIKKIHLPRKAVLPVTIDGNIIDHDEVTRISALIFAWSSLILIGSLITVMFSDLGPFEGFSGMASAVGNIGPFYFSVEKMISLSPVIKVTYIVGMLAGRLELLPLMILFSRRSWR
jgi:trk system potassium uptake protein TrkH